MTDWEWVAQCRGSMSTIRSLRYPITPGYIYRYIARIEKRLGKHSLEIWRENMGVWEWEFVRRFDDLEEAKAAWIALAKLELV